MPHPSEFPELKKKAVTLFEAVQNLDAAILEDADKQIANGIPAYLAAQTKESLKRAEELLKKDHYKLCFAGGFSGGKSTTINALMEECDLLPTAAGECTLSITMLTGPLGGKETLRITYFPRDIAIRNVVFHQKRYRNAFAQYEDDCRGAGPDKLLELVNKVCEWLPSVHADEGLPEPLRKEYDKGKATKYAAELQEFLHYMDKYSNRCGRVHEDDIANAKAYLTYDDHQGGLGHLFMIEQVSIHKRNELFEQKGVQIVDLPGIDSTNAYARQVTLDYLNEADLVINVLPPQGFTMSYIDIINEVSEACRGNIANKMFYVVNRFDANEDRNFSKKELESLLRDQIAAEIDKNGLNSRNLFATVALFDIYRLRGDQEGFDNLLQTCKGKLDKMGGDVDEPWQTIATDALTGKGIDKLRTKILAYLHEQLAFERLRDVRLLLQSVLDAVAELIGKNQAQVDLALSSKTTLIAQIRQFVDGALTNFHHEMSKLGVALPEMIEKVIKAQLKPRINEQLERFRAITPLNEEHQQVRFTGKPAPTQAPAAVKQHWIDWAKRKYCDAFVVQVHDVLAGNVRGLVTQQVGAARIDKVVEYLEGVTEATLGAEIGGAIKGAEQTIDAVTKLRAEEEVWQLLEQPIHPQGFQAAWNDEVERSFKDDIIGNFSRLFASYADNLSTVLGNYYRSILERLVTDVQSQSDKLEAALRSVDDLSLPMELVEGEQDPERERKVRLLSYYEKSKSAASMNVELIESL